MQPHRDSNHEPPDGSLPSGRFCVDGGGSFGIVWVRGNFVEESRLEK